MTTSTHKCKHNALWLGLGIAIVLGIAWQFIPLSDAQDRMSRLPQNGLDYIGKDIPFQPFEKKLLKDVHAIKRLYTFDDEQFLITVIDGTHNRHVIHDPYYCFTGSGWSLMDEKDIPIKKGWAKQIVLGKDGKQREALFWFSNGNEQYASPWKYWMQTTLRRITLGLSGSEPILIIIQPKQIGHTDWEKFFHSFQVLFMI